jgi:hypothetical protein
MELIKHLDLDLTQDQFINLQFGLKYQQITDIYIHIVLKLYYIFTQTLFFDIDNICNMNIHIRRLYAKVLIRIIKSFKLFHFRFMIKISKILKLKLTSFNDNNILLEVIKPQLAPLLFLIFKIEKIIKSINHPSTLQYLTLQKLISKTKSTNINTFVILNAYGELINLEQCINFNELNNLMISYKFKNINISLINIPSPLKQKLLIDCAFNQIFINSFKIDNGRHINKIIKYISILNFVISDNLQNIIIKLITKKYN